MNSGRVDEITASVVVITPGHFRWVAEAFVVIIKRDYRPLGWTLRRIDAYRL